MLSRDNGIVSGRNGIVLSRNRMLSRDNGIVGVAIGLWRVAIGLMAVQREGGWGDRLGYVGLWGDPEQLRQNCPVFTQAVT